jgi:membrane-bound lytic murein transglycosylase D
MHKASARLLIFSLAILIPNPGSAQAGSCSEREDRSITQSLPNENQDETGGDSGVENDRAHFEGIESQSGIEPILPFDLWERLRRGFALGELNDEEVPYNEDHYTHRPDHIKRIAERSRRYLFHIMEEVERRNMPAEIALLPIIESALNPAAHSHRHASGLWQLTPSTAKRYGLKQNWWHDERRDIIAATSAALDYLKKLHGLFGDWRLVLASYNWGEGAVRRALTRNRNSGQAADFESITLPPETRNFIQRLVVLKNIISDPAAFRIDLGVIPNKPYFEKITAFRHMDIKLAAKLANISLNEFKALNPAHNRPVINIDSSKEILIPADKVQVFSENLRNHDRPLVSWHAYRVKNGETLETIAERFGISVKRLKVLNDLDAGNDIVSGEPLLVPGGGSHSGEDISAMSNKPATLKVPEGFVVYVVKKGDVLFNIAKRHGMTVEEIKYWNRSTNRLMIGQKLVLKQV